jgi:hypothetical protein
MCVPWRGEQCASFYHLHASHRHALLHHSYRHSSWCKSSVTLVPCRLSRSGTSEYLMCRLSPTLWSQREICVLYFLRPTDPCRPISLDCISEGYFKGWNISTFNKWCIETCALMERGVRSFSADAGNTPLASSVYPENLQTSLFTLTIQLGSR